MGRVFKVDFLRPTPFLNIKADRRGVSEGRISNRLLRPTILMGTKYFGLGKGMSAPGRARVGDGQLKLG